MPSPKKSDAERIMEFFENAELETAKVVLSLVRAKVKARDEVELPEVTVKPRRKRRTKAQMEAAKVAVAEAK